MREAAPAGLRQRGFRALGRGDISLSGATHFCQQRQKWAKAPPKTNGFWISFVPVSMRREKVLHGIDHGSTLAAADVVGRESRWVYRYRRLSNRALAAALLRSAFCKTVCQHAAAKPINQRIAARNTGAAAGRDVQAIRCTTISIYFGFRGVRGHIFRHGQARRKA